MTKKRRPASMPAPDELVHFNFCKALGVSRCEIPEAPQHTYALHVSIGGGVAMAYALTESDARNLLAALQQTLRTEETRDHPDTA